MSVGRILRIAAWNLEHLDDTGTDGCLPREQAGLRCHRGAGGRFRPGHHCLSGSRKRGGGAPGLSQFRLACRDFPAAPERNAGPPCRGRPGQRLGHLATGLAIRRGIAYRRNADLDVLGEATSFQRWGTDITVRENGQELRLLSVHLTSGCWGMENDQDPGDERLCTVLRGQINRLKAWADARRAEREAFVILGDFNRRLAVAGDWAWELLSPSSAVLHLPTGELDHSMRPSLHGTDRPPRAGRRRRRPAAAGFRK